MQTRTGATLSFAAIGLGRNGQGTATTWLRRSLAILAALTLVLLDAARALAAPVPFTCNNVPYVTWAGQLHTINMATSPFTATPIFGNQGGDLDGIGFNPVDGLIYAITLNGQIKQIDATGAQVNLGTPPGINTSVRWAEGAFASNGSFFVTTELGSNWAEINVATTPPTVLSQGTFPGGIILGDGAINPIDGLYYAWDNTNHRLVRVDFSSATPTPVPVGTATYPNIVEGGAYFTSDGSFYVIYQGTGPAAGGPPNAFARVDTTTGVPTLVSDGQPPYATWPWDAASCPFTVTLKKQVAPSPVIPGNQTTVTFTVRNASTFTATGNFSDTLPGGHTFVGGTLSSTLGGTANAYGGTSTLQIAGMTMPPDSVTTITVTVQIPPGATPGTVADQASLDVTGPTLLAGVQLSDDPATPPVGDPTQYVVAPPQADIEMVSKTAAPASVSTGGTITFTMVVRNNGPSNAAAVTVSDPLPAGLTFTAAGSDPTCSGTTTVSCTIGALAAGTTRTIIVVATVVAGAPAGPATNVATAASPTLDPVPGNESKPATFQIVRSADLGITATGPASVQPGDPVTYTLVVTNHGPDTSSGFTLTGAIPANLTGVTVTAPPGCTLTPPILTCPNPLPLNGTQTITVTGVADPALTTGPFTGTATVTALQAGEDTNPVNDTASVTTNVTPTANLGITIAETTPPVAGGASGSYAITVTNAGPSTSVAPVVTVPLPPGVPAGTVFDLTNTSTACTGPATGPLTCTLADLASGGTDPLTVALSFPPSTPAGTAFTVSTSVTSTTPDPVLANNTASVASTVTRNPDLAITISGAPQPATPLGAFTYTLQASDLGPSDSTGATVTMPIPPELTGATTSTPGCAIAGGVLTCTLNLTAGAPATVITVTGTIAGTATGSMTATATVAAGPGETDPVLTNNTRSDTVNIVSVTALSVAKTGPAFAIVGSSTPITFTVTAHNGGPSIATNAVVTDTLPAGLTLVSVTPSVGTCTTSPSITCSLGTMATGATETILITATVDSSVPHGTTITNTAHLTTAENPTGVTDGATVGMRRQADLSVTKSGPATVAAGTNITYTLTAHNLGPSDSGPVNLNDLLPSGLTFVSSSLVGCAGRAAGTNCSLGPIVAGGSVPFTITASVDPTLPVGTVLANRATVSGPETDPDDTNNSAAVSSTVTHAYDLSVTKQVLTSPVVAGHPVTFSLTASNAGPSEADAVQVVDTLPAGLTFTQPSDSSCSAVGQVVTCTLASIGVGQSVPLTITADVNPALAPGNHNNTATVSSTDGGIDLNPGNDTVTVPVPVTAEADLQLDKVPATVPLPFIPGEPADYGLAVTNNGPSTAVNVVVTDVLPNLTTFNPALSDPACSAAGQQITCTLATLAPGALHVFVVSGALSPDVTGSLTDSGHVTAATSDLQTDNNDAIVTVPTDPEASVTLSKVASTLTPIAGTSFTYSLQVTNDGPSTTPSVKVVDTLPAPLAFVSGAGCTAAGQVVTCTFTGPLQPTQSHTFIVVVAVPADATLNEPLTNGAVATTPLDRPPGPDIPASVTVRPAGLADVSLTKMAFPTQVQRGGTVVYHLVIANAGPSRAHVDLLTDPIPTGLTFVDYHASNPLVRCVLFHRVVDCDLITVDPGQSETIDVLLRVDANAPLGPLGNTAVLSTAVPDPTTADHRASAVVVVVAGLPAPGPELPVTGGRLWPWPVGGAVLVMLGTALLLVRRRREPEA
jgi:uncharacterized repeat protein (TIGR01451 family)